MYQLHHRYCTTHLIVHIMLRALSNFTCKSQLLVFVFACFTMYRIRCRQCTEEAFQCVEVLNIVFRLITRICNLSILLHQHQFHCTSLNHLNFCLSMHCFFLVCLNWSYKQSTVISAVWLLTRSRHLRMDLDLAAFRILTTAWHRLLFIWSISLYTHRHCVIRSYSNVNHHKLSYWLFTQ